MRILLVCALSFLALPSAFSASSEREPANDSDTYSEIVQVMNDLPEFVRTALGDMNVYVEHLHVSAPSNDSSSQQIRVPPRTRQSNMTTSIPAGLQVLEANGEASEIVTADMADVKIAVEARFQSEEALTDELSRSGSGPNRTEVIENVQREAAARTARVVDLLKAWNIGYQNQAITRLITAGVRLEPIYKYTSGLQHLVGYTSTNQISFRVPASQAGEILDQLTSLGLSRIDSVTFSASELSIAKSRVSAVQRATLDSIIQALAMIRTLGAGRTRPAVLRVLSTRVTRVTSPSPRIVPMNERGTMGVEYMERTRIDPSFNLPSISQTTPVLGNEREISSVVALKAAWM